jgi:predicted PurR-regulated permease PerM
MGAVYPKSWRGNARRSRLPHVLVRAAGPGYVGFVMVFFDFLIPFALAAVFAILCFGIYTLFRGGDFGRSWSNKAMRMRIVAQFIAIVILMAALLVKKYLG